MLHHLHFSRMFIVQTYLLFTFFGLEVRNQMLFLFILNFVSNRLTIEIRDFIVLDGIDQIFSVGFKVAAAIKGLINLLYSMVLWSLVTY